MILVLQFDGIFDFLGTIIILYIVTKIASNRCDEQEKQAKIEHNYARNPPQSWCEDIHACTLYSCF